jgi:hypothetical protein
LRPDCFHAFSSFICLLPLLLSQVQAGIQCQALPASLGPEVEQIAREMQGGASPYFRLGMLLEPGEADRLTQILRAQVCSFFV